MENIEEIKKQIVVMKSALKNRMGNDKSEEFYGRVLHESKTELEYFGDKVDERDLLKRIFGRLERKNEYLVDLEREKSNSS
ncbi:MAG: hypothetical protein PHS95_03065 [Candidatus Pacebacteria bacterium]|nr:hypothetical protein [Candidatus Paceibacterota bacterium]